VTHGAGAVQRVRLELRGAVQGVGFRPFVYRLAQRCGVSGWVANDTAGVTIEAEADAAVIEYFMRALSVEAPPQSSIHELSASPLAPEGSAGFRIVSSAAGGARSAVVLPDLAPCDDCMREVRDPADGRAGYAFTNCTNCGPRFSIIQGLPYDRPSTTMAHFRMCADCASEYDQPLDRRFHAQPNACARCGPRLELWDARGVPVAGVDPVAGAAAALRRGEVVAVKGTGGFHLMVDACSDRAVATLRERKRRPHRPLAVMAMSVEQARRFVAVDGAAAALLQSAAAPIVLLPRRTATLHAVRLDPAAEPAAGLAPDNPRIGVMLPAMPLHHLLLAEFGGPVVATSGNLSDEPICTDEGEAVARLCGIADLFLVHDRPIERHVDDSVADFVDGAPRLLRRARGYAPLPLRLPAPVPPILAVGPHLKNTIALARDRQVFISQHIGDLETYEAQRAFERVIEDFLRLYDVSPDAVARDMHPDYVSTQWALRLVRQLGFADVPVQHHHAHLVACMAENDVTEPTLGVVWDGTGYGTDGTIWGGEFLLGDACSFDRMAHLLPFRLPGGDAAAREPRRAAASLVFAACGRDGFEHAAAPLLRTFRPAQRGLLLHMLQRHVNAPLTTSAGRLFDGIAALLGICTVASYEGEAAVRLEHCVDRAERGAYSIPILPEACGPSVLDWRPMVRDVMDDARRDVPQGVIAARVHNALVDAVALQAELVGCANVALTGGCFQNVILTERTAAALRRRGFNVLLHRQVPPNDGGVSFGQVVIAAARLGAVAPGSAGASAAGMPIPSAPGA
jgi:hydrogenase maturation protein HypF